MVLMLLTASFAGCLGGDPANPDTGNGDAAACDHGPDQLVACIHTTEGVIHVELLHEEVPVTVANFVRYAHEGFYDGTIFHRVISNFMLQGGGLTPDLEKKDVHAPIPLDRPEDLNNERGTISMARTKNPHSATSQFFINVENNTNLDRPPGYAVFGRVVEGMDVVDTIRNVETHTEGGRENVPVEDVVITSVSLSLPEDDPVIRIVPATPDLDLGANATGLAAFQLVNGWDAPRTVTVEASGDTASVSVPRGDGTATVDLAPGGSALVLANVPTGPSNPTVGVSVTSGDLSDDATVTVTRNEPGGAAVEEGMKVDLRYAGYLDTGILFDTDMRYFATAEGFRTAAGQGERTTLLKVWTGDGQSPDPEYTTVIPGFRDALLGLHEGDANLAYVPPAEGYQDGVDRWFLVDIETVHT